MQLVIFLEFDMSLDFDDDDDVVDEVHPSDLSISVLELRRELYKQIVRCGTCKGLLGHSSQVFAVPVASHKQVKLLDSTCTIVDYFEKQV